MRRPQTGQHLSSDQTNGFSPVWIFKCCLKLNLLELMRRPQTGQHLSSDQWSFMCTLKLSRLVSTLVHLMQSIGQRSFWIWFSYSLTAVFVVESPPWLDEWLLGLHRHRRLGEVVQGQPGRVRGLGRHPRCQNCRHLGLFLLDQAGQREGEAEVREGWVEQGALLRLELHSVGRLLCLWQPALVVVVVVLQRGRRRQRLLSADVDRVREALSKVVHLELVVVVVARHGGPWAGTCLRRGAASQVYGRLGRRVLIDHHLPLLVLAVLLRLLVVFSNVPLCHALHFFIGDKGKDAIARLDLLAAELELLLDGLVADVV